MLVWFLYFKIAHRIWSSILSIKVSYLEYFEIPRLLTKLEKNLFKRTSAVSYSVLTNSPFSDKFNLVMILSENDGFITFQKSLLSRISFSFKFAKYFFLDFFKSETLQFLWFVHKVLFCSFLFLRKLLRSFDLFIIVFERSFVINGIWLPRASFFLRGTCLFEILILILQNLCKPSSLLIKTSFESSCNRDSL